MYPKDRYAYIKHSKLYLTSLADNELFRRADMSLKLLDNIVCEDSENI